MVVFCQIERLLLHQMVFLGWNGQMPRNHQPMPAPYQGDDTYGGRTTLYMLDVSRERPNHPGASAQLSHGAIGVYSVFGTSLWKNLDYCNEKRCILLASERPMAVSYPTATLDCS